MQIENPSTGFSPADVPDLSIAASALLAQPSGDESSCQQWFVGASAKSLTDLPFGRAFKERRCIVPASGFFEWQEVGAEADAAVLSHVEIGRPCRVRRAVGIVA